MRLTEYEGKKLFARYGIAIPKGILAQKKPIRGLSFPVVLKAQTLSGMRLAQNLILKAQNARELHYGFRTIKKILPKIKILIEESLQISREYYLSFTFDTAKKTPVFLFSKNGGSKISKANKLLIDFTKKLEPFHIRIFLAECKVSSRDILPITSVAISLWNIFVNEAAILTEINPLIKTTSGEFRAADAKIILDTKSDSFENILRFDGDIGLLASGGGASLVNLDALIYAGGKPANYAEFSGNPPREKVRALTEKVLAQNNLKGLWIVGGVANFTDIYETMLGVADALVKARPLYPIVIRRDGPRQKAAFTMMKKIKEEYGLNIHLYGSEISMEESAKILMNLIHSY